MAVKTVSLKTEAYERLKAARKYPTESFSEVILRARWPEDTITSTELLRIFDEEEPTFTAEELDAIEAAKEAVNQPPEDKWRKA
jgi:predicted CopG family antitoxin